MSNDKIKCPSCGTEIDVSEALAHDIGEKLQADFDKKARDLKVKENEVASREEMLTQTINDTVKTKLTAEKQAIETSLRASLTQESKETIESMQKELDEKSRQLGELNKAKADILRLEREKTEMRDTINLEKERELTTKINEERVKMKQLADEENDLKKKELEKQLEDQKKLIDEMTRKIEQGSTQLQGEIQELVLEESLRRLFPFDLISEVGKGVNGADVVHTVRNSTGQDCGVILIESKRTKSFGTDWVDKLKTDAVKAKADLCVIITEAMPKDIQKIGIIDGVWITSMQDFHGLLMALRHGLIQAAAAFGSQANKGEKMEMLYAYLTGNEFRNQLGAIIDGFTELSESYQQEKRAMERIWKQREKQLERVLLNSNHFIGAIKGIAGASLGELKMIGQKDNILEEPK